MNVAYTRMRLYDVSQLPVLDGAKIVGILDESDLLLAAMDDAGAFSGRAQGFMTTKLANGFVRGARRGLAADLRRRAGGALWPTAKSFYGLITRVDVVSYLRRQHGVGLLA